MDTKALDIIASVPATADKSGPVIGIVAAKAIAEALIAGGYITLRRDELVPAPLEVFQPPQE
jgi:hypothetical protein